MTTNARINCRTCTYFYITWDAARPNGCKFHGFKSREMPDMIVYKSSGILCQAYTAKNSPK
jgi:hypothetical protein